MTMRSKTSRCISTILAICMMVTMSPFIADGWNNSGHADAASVKPAKKITYKCTGNQANDIVGIARTQLGYKPYTEGTSAYGQFWGKSCPWCANFVCWSAYKAGIKNLGTQSYSKKRASYFASTASPAYFKGTRFNRGKKEPQKGDLVFFLWSYHRGKYSYSHIEIVSSTTKNTVTTIGGNTGKGAGKVSQRTWSKKESQIVCYVRPNYKNTSAVSHQFTYNMNGGSGNTSAQTVKDGGTIAVHNKPSRTGHTFRGYYAKRKADQTWFVAGKGWCAWDTIVKKKYTAKLYTAGGKYTLDKSWTNGSPKSNYEFKAQWRPNTFTVKYNANGGKGTMADVKHTYDVKKNLTPNRFIRDGYTFDCWYAHRKSDNKWAYSKGNQNGWYARDKQPAGYSLTRYNNGGWIAWTTSADNDVITFYANWKENPKPVVEPEPEPEPIPDEEPNVEDDSVGDDGDEWEDPIDESEQEDPTEEPEAPVEEPTDPADESAYDWTTWSDYSTARPEELDGRQIETKTEYRYRDKQTVKSGRDSLSGYTKESTQTTGTSYGKWLVGEQKGSTSVTDAKKTVVTVETKSANLSYAYYCKCKKVCWKTTGGKCKYCGGKTNYGKLRIYSSKSLSASGYKKDTDGSYFLPTTVRKSSPGKLGEIYCMKWKDGHIDSFTTGSTVGGKNTFVWPDGRATLYRTKTTTYVNTFSRWGNWSDWSQTNVTSTGTRQVETRILYRYRDWVEQ